jgi:hypothetical protein
MKAMVACYVARATESGTKVITRGLLAGVP